MDEQTTAQGLIDKAHELTDAAKTRLGAVAETARAKTGNLQAHMADLLDDSAARLRTQSAALAPQGPTTGEPGGRELTGTSPSAEAGHDPLTDGPLARATATVKPIAAERGQALAGIMEAGATWLREHDLSDLEGGLTSQVQRYPVRSLAIAAALGYLVSRRRE